MRSSAKPPTPATRARILARQSRSPVPRAWDPESGGSPAQWSAAKALRYIVHVADQHATGAPKEDATDADEGFWNVVFPVLENHGLDAETEVKGVSLEDHYLAALAEAKRDLTG
jgi:hypothetical protein